MLDRIVGPLLPVAFVILLGFVAGKRGKLNHSDSLLISRLVLNWIFPALCLPAWPPRPVRSCSISGLSLRRSSESWGCTPLRSRSDGIAIVN